MPKIVEILEIAAEIAAGFISCCVLATVLVFFVAFVVLP